jgi:prepilin peptidase CpaA
MGTRQTTGGSPTIWITDLVSLLTIGLLAVAAASDLATRTIPDQACIALALLGLGVRLFTGITALALSAGVAVALFAVLVLAHARGALGGGDVKLAAAMALGLAPAQTYRFVVATVLAGGVLGLLHLALRRVPPPAPSLARAVARSGSRCSGLASLVRRIATVERWRIRRNGSLPYGIAIACGGAWVMLTGVGG